MKHYSGLYFILLCLLFSCHPLELENEQHVRQTPIQCRTKSPALGDFVNNPYEIHNMQHANDSLCNLFNEPTIELDPTDVYVRFLPKDSVEYRTMLSLGTEFFDLPLTFEPYDPICSYRDPSVPDTLITWQYTMVPYGTTLPNIEYEVIDTCCIPFNLRSSPIEGYNVLLDKLANRIANPGAKYLEDESDHKIATEPTRSIFPSGRALVRMNGVDVPLRHVKIRVKHITYYACTYTDDDGYYTIPKSFIYDPQYEIAFENNLGFSEYDCLLSPTPSWSNFQNQSKYGYNFYICYSYSPNIWLAAVVNNRIVEYYDLCTAENRQLPPPNMRVLLWTGAAPGSGAPMLKQIGCNSLVGLSFFEIIQGLLYRYVGTIPSMVVGCLKYVLPDLFILYDSYLTTEETLQTKVFHELNHASHYAKAGLSVWSGVIADTIRNSFPEDHDYGDGTINDSAQDACELAESWAYANQIKLINDNSYPYIPHINPSALWFMPTIEAINNLVDTTRLLTRAQVLDAMTSNVLSVDDLCASLKNTYSNKRIRINNVFAEKHVLNNQTVWRVNNNTGQTLVFSIRKGTTVVHNWIASDSTFVVTSVPSTALGFYATWNPTYSAYNPDEFFIRKQSNASMVYHQYGNGNVLTPMNRPFFVENQWAVLDSLHQIGNNRIIEYTYTLTSSDIQ